MLRRRFAAAVICQTFFVSTLSSQQTSCTTGSETYNGQPVTTETYTDGSTTVKNIKDSGGSIIRTEQTNIHGDLTIVNYNPTIGCSTCGSERNHAVLVADDGDMNSHSSTVSDTDSQNATTNMKAAHNACNE